MKLQLDTTNKTIKVEGDVKFAELIKTLDKLLPKSEWKEFTLETNTTIVSWQQPYYVPYKHYEPYWRPWISYTTSGGTSTQKSKDWDVLSMKGAVGSSSLTTYAIKDGTYNIEV